MKTIVSIFALALSLLACPSMFGQVPDKLVEALIAHESNGNTRAIGDNGRAVGCLQIHTSVIDNVNAKKGTKHKYSDRYSKAKSKKICKQYLEIFACKSRLGHEPTYEDYARIWNGGPNGWKKECTKKYWEELKAKNPGF